MLMDEPTNHLDLQSSESLTASLGTYDGTLVFVSHNRSLIRALATRIWNVEEQRVETYPGTLDEYMYSMAERRQAVAIAGQANVKRDPRGKVSVAVAPAKTREDDKVRKRKEAEERQKRNTKFGPLEKQVAQLEERIAVLEAEQKMRSAELADPSVYEDAARRNKLLADFQTGSDKLDELTARWETTAAQLEAARRDMIQDS